MGGGGGGPSRLSQVTGRRKDIESRISGAENITDVTRQEFQTRFGTLFNALEAQKTGNIADLEKAFGSDRSSQEFQRRKAKIEAGEVRGDISQQDFDLFSGEAGSLEGELDEAIRGEGLFGRRQARTALQERLRDRPGARQTRGGSLLTGGAQAGGGLTLTGSGS